MGDFFQEGKKDLRIEDIRLLLVLLTAFSHPYHLARGAYVIQKHQSQ